MNNKIVLIAELIDLCHMCSEYREKYRGITMPIKVIVEYHFGQHEDKYDKYRKEVKKR